MHFTISKVTVNWHELMILQHIMWSLIACAIEQLQANSSLPQSVTLGLYPRS